MQHKTKKKLRVIRNITLLFICAGLIYAYIEARNIKTVSFIVESSDIPNTFDGKKIVFVADIHCDQYFKKEDVEILVDRINDMSPDMVILGGDYVTRVIDIQPFIEGIAGLKSPHGVYTVMGNHDSWTDVEALKNGFIGHGFVICDNASSWLRIGNDSIKIGGVGDLWYDVQILENTINDVEKDDYCILLSHQPNYIDSISTDKIDLMLSGHTHAGQVTFFGLYAPVMAGQMKSYLQTSKREYRYGWVEKNGVRIYVTSGIGMGGLPFRFFAQPEIVEITLRKK